MWFRLGSGTNSALPSRTAAGCSGAHIVREEDGGHPAVSDPAFVLAPAALDEVRCGGAQGRVVRRRRAARVESRQYAGLRVRVEQSQDPSLHVLVAGRGVRDERFTSVRALERRVEDLPDAGPPRVRHRSMISGDGGREEHQRSRTRRRIAGYTTRRRNGSMSATHAIVSAPRTAGTSQSRGGRRVCQSVTVWKACATLRILSSANRSPTRVVVRGCGFAAS